MIGILMLDTRFPRLPGDIGNPVSFSEPPRYQYVSGASVQEVVSDKPLSDPVLGRFQRAASELESNGATVIGTSCGFLSRVQHEIERSVNVPFLSSSLMLIPLLRRMFGSKSNIGVLTFDDSKLGPAHFAGESDSFISIHGLSPSSSYRNAIATDAEYIDQEAARIETIEVAERCIDRQPDTTLFLIECTNLSPWKNQIRSQFGLPVFDLVDALEWIDGSMPARQRLDIAEGK